MSFSLFLSPSLSPSSSLSKSNKWARVLLRSIFFNYQGDNILFLPQFLKVKE